MHSYVIKATRLDGCTENKLKLEGTCESAYIHQVNFYRRPFLKKNLRVISGMSL